MSEASEVIDALNTATVSELLILQFLHRLYDEAEFTSRQVVKDIASADTLASVERANAARGLHRAWSTGAVNPLNARSVGIALSHMVGKHSPGSERLALLSIDRNKKDGFTRHWRVSLEHVAAVPPRTLTPQRADPVLNELRQLDSDGRRLKRAQSVADEHNAILEIVRESNREAELQRDRERMLQGWQRTERNHAEAADPTNQWLILLKYRVTDPGGWHPETGEPLPRIANESYRKSAEGVLRGSLVRIDRPGLNLWGMAGGMAGTGALTLQSAENYCMNTQAMLRPFYATVLPFRMDWTEAAQATNHRNAVYTPKPSAYVSQTDNTFDRDRYDKWKNDQRAAQGPRRMEWNPYTILD